MINNYNKAVLSMVALNTMNAHENSYLYDNYKEKILEAIFDGKVVTIADYNSAKFRQCGKTTMLLEMHGKIKNSLVIVGNTQSREYAEYKYMQMNFTKLPRVLVVKDSNLDCLRGYNSNYVLFIDDSVSEDVVKAIKKKEEFYTFGFTYKAPVDLI